MREQHNGLNKWGWCDWFEQRAECLLEESIARVAAVDRDQLLVVDQNGVFRAKLAGSYMHHHRLSHERPCVGDWVGVEKPAGDGMGVIRAVLERRSFLRRKAVGNAVELQMIAANVDCVFIVQSCHFDFNLKRLERYLAMVLEGRCEPYVLLTKTDLVEPGVLEAQLAEIRAAGIVVPIATASNLTGEGLDTVERILEPGKTYCFVGSSGVGKSTLINRLVGREVLETGDLSNTGEGRHTTVRRELIRLDAGALVIDNPGMREFGVFCTEDSLESSHSSISALSQSCRFRDCTHTGEPGCAIAQAIESGEISQDALESYLKLKKESDFYELSYVEKRKKDRNFGKYIKSVKKDLGYD